MEEFVKLVTVTLQDDWADGGIWGYNLIYDVQNKDENILYIGCTSFYWAKFYIIEGLNVDHPHTAFPTLSVMKVLQTESEYNGVKEQWWDLQIFDMSQAYEDDTPALLIRAKEFNIYEIETEKDEEGNIKDRPNLADFIKWKEEQEESKEMVNK